MSHAEFQFQAYAVGAVALIAVAFYACRRMPAFVVASSAVVSGFAAITYQSARAAGPADRVVMTAGLVASVAGLTLVRAMLQRSVSLHMLETVDRGGSGSFRHDVDDRVNDLRRFGLARSTNGRNALTVFGRLVGTAAAACYFVLQMDV